jgi:hypothetical protein
MNVIETISSPRCSQRLAAQQAIAANINEGQQPNIEVEPDPPLGADLPPINAEPAAIINPIKPDELDTEDQPKKEPEPDMADPVKAGAAGAFALTPAAAHQNILDYTLPEHAKLLNKAIAPLEGDEYDGTPEKLKGFLDRLQQKAEDYTWLDSVLIIPVDPGPPVISRNLIDDYGNISLEKVREHAATYVGIAAGSSKWQNSHQLKTCLESSHVRKRQVARQKSSRWSMSPQGCHLARLY